MDYVCEQKVVLPNFKVFLTEKLGYHVIVNPYMIKLEKLPGLAEEWMGISEFESTMEYAFLCILLMFLEDRGRDEQFVLLSITEFIQGSYPGEEKVDWTLYRHRRCLIKVLRFASQIGMIKVDDGDEQHFANDEKSEVLYESTGLSRYFVRNFTTNILNCSSYNDIEEKDIVEIDKDKGIVRRHRVYRRLVMSPTNLNEYEDAIASGNEYRDALYEVENKHQKLIINYDKLVGIREVKENLDEDIENINWDLVSKGRKLRELDAFHTSCLEQLKLSNYDEIKSEIDECVTLIAQMPKLIEKEITRREQEKAGFNRAVEELESINEKIKLDMELLNIYKASFMEENKLGYWQDYDDNQNLLRTAKNVIKEIKLDDKITKDDLISQLHGKFQENNQYLREYIVRIDNIFETTEEYYK